MSHDVLWAYHDIVSCTDSFGRGQIHCVFLYNLFDVCLSRTSHGNSRRRRMCRKQPPPHKARAPHWHFEKKRKNVSEMASDGGCSCLGRERRVCLVCQQPLANCISPRALCSTNIGKERKMPIRMPGASTPRSRTGISWPRSLPSSEKTLTTSLVGELCLTMGAFFDPVIH